MKEIIESAATKVPGYFMELLEVSSGPKRFIAQKKIDENESVNEASIFLAITLLIAFLIQMPLLPSKENLLVSFASATVLNGLLLLVTLMIIRFAWLIVGGKADFRSLYVATAYLLAPMLFIMLLFFLLGDSIFRLADPEGYRLLLKNPNAELTNASRETGGFFTAILFCAIGIFLAYIWFFVAWGAYRNLNRVGRFRSFIAFVTYNVLSIPLWGMSLILAVHLGTPMT